MQGMSQNAAGAQAIMAIIIGALTALLIGVTVLCATCSHSVRVTDGTETDPNPGTVDSEAVSKRMCIWTSLRSCFLLF